MNWCWQDIEWWFINLSNRTDRLLHIKSELLKAGITTTRFDALRKEDYNGPPEHVARMQHTPNTIGNWLSHVAIIRKAAESGGIVGLLEDDALLCSDFTRRLQYIQEHFCRSWDIFFLGATFHADEAVWHPELERDCEMTDVRHILRVYGAFSNQGYLINGESAPRILEMMEEVMPNSRGSDHALIQIQPALNCYAFVPGMVFQIDGQSDIGQGITRFSNFRKSLGEYVWADRLEEFDYDTWARGRT